MLVSRLPFIRLFQALLSLVAPEYFDKLAPCLEAGKWPPGATGEVSSLAVEPSGFGRQAPNTNHLRP